MRQKILTEREKQAIKDYLEKGDTSQVIYNLRARARKFLPVIQNEVDLLKKLLESSPKIKS